MRGEGRYVTMEIMASHAKHAAAAQSLERPSDAEAQGNSLNLGDQELQNRGERTEQRRAQLLQTVATVAAAPVARRRREPSRRQCPPPRASARERTAHPCRKSKASKASRTAAAATKKPAPSSQPWAHRQRRALRARGVRHLDLRALLFARRGLLVATKLGKEPRHGIRGLQSRRHAQRLRGRDALEEGLAGWHTAAAFLGVALRR